VRARDAEMPLPPEYNSTLCSLSGPSALGLRNCARTVLARTVLGTGYSKRPRTALPVRYQRAYPARKSVTASRMCQSVSQSIPY
jgi:hypothetical protein